MTSLIEDMDSPDHSDLAEHNFIETTTVEDPYLQDLALSFIVIELVFCIIMAYLIYRELD